MADVDRLKHELATERSWRQQLEAKVSALQSALDERTAQLEELFGSREALHKHLQRHGERGTRLAASLASLEEENASLTAQILAGTNEREQLLKQMDAMKMRVVELQQGYVSMASCTDTGMDGRDLLRRSRLGSLARDVEAAGALDISAATADVTERNAAAKASSTIAALTRERDVLQQRVHQLSGRLAEVAGREGAARGAQALRNAAWKKSAVQAEAKLTSALRRAKELGEEVRKREADARQRDKYVAQLERTIMAQHKSLQEQRRLLEAGLTAGAASGAAERRQEEGADIEARAPRPPSRATSSAAGAAAWLQGPPRAGGPGGVAGSRGGAAGAGGGDALAGQLQELSLADVTREQVPAGALRAQGPGAGAKGSTAPSAVHGIPLNRHGTGLGTQRGGGAGDHWEFPPPPARSSFDAGVAAWQQHSAMQGAHSEKGFAQDHGGREDGIVGSGPEQAWSPQPPSAPRAPPGPRLHEQLSSVEAHLAQLYAELEGFKDHSPPPARPPADSVRTPGGMLLASLHSASTYSPESPSGKREGYRDGGGGWIGSPGAHGGTGGAEWVSEDEEDSEGGMEDEEGIPREMPKDAPVRRSASGQRSGTEGGSSVRSSSCAGIDVQRKGGRGGTQATEAVPRARLKQAWHDGPPNQPGRPSVQRQPTLASMDGGSCTQQFVARHAPPQHRSHSGRNTPGCSSDSCSDGEERAGQHEPCLPRRASERIADLATKPAHMAPGYPADDHDDADGPGAPSTKEQTAANDKQRLASGQRRSSGASGLEEACEGGRRLQAGAGDNEHQAPDGDGLSPEPLPRALGHLLRCSHAKCHAASPPLPGGRIMRPGVHRTTPPPQRQQPLRQPTWAATRVQGTANGTGPQSPASRRPSDGTPRILRGATPQSNSCQQHPRQYGSSGGANGSGVAAGRAAAARSPATGVRAVSQMDGGQATAVGRSAATPGLHTRPQTSGAPAGAASIRSTPAHSPTRAQAWEPQTAHIRTVAEPGRPNRGASRQQPSSPEVPSPISTLLANLAGSPQAASVPSRPNRALADRDGCPEPRGTDASSSLHSEPKGPAAVRVTSASGSGGGAAAQAGPRGGSKRRSEADWEMEEDHRGRLERRGRGSTGGHSSESDVGGGRRGAGWSAASSSCAAAAGTALLGSDGSERGTSSGSHLARPSTGSHARMSRGSSILGGLAPRGSIAAPPGTAEHLYAADGQERRNQERVAQVPDGSAARQARLSGFPAGQGHLRGGAAGAEPPAAQAVPAASDVALQRLREKRLARLQQHQQRQVHTPAASGSGAAGAQDADPTAQQPAPVVLTLRASMQGELHISPRPTAGSRLGTKETHQEQAVKGGGIDCLTVHLEMSGRQGNGAFLVPADGSDDETREHIAMLEEPVASRTQPVRATTVPSPPLSAVREGLAGQPEVQGGQGAGGARGGAEQVPSLQHLREAMRASAGGINRDAAADCSQRDTPDLRVAPREEPSFNVSGVLRQKGAGFRHSAEGPLCENGPCGDGVNGGVSSLTHQQSGAAHPLMRLLGEASADLQMLSKRLQPVVAGNANRDS